MKQQLLKNLRLRAVMLVAILCAGFTSAWGETYTLGWGTASGDAGTYTNFTATSGSVTNIVSFSTAKNDAGTAPAYNSNNSDLRLYYNAQGNGGSITLTPATGVTITGFVMTTSTSPSVKYTVDGGTATSVTVSNNTYTVNNISASSSLMIQNVNTTNTQLRIKTIQITYTTSGSITPTCDTPTFSPAAGAVVSGTTVTISTTTEGATIYYTTNGNNPTTSSSVYSAPIEITAATTIKAIAAKTDYNNSEVASATYTIKQVVSGYTIDFENGIDAYTDWTITNAEQAANSISAHGGTHYGTTGGKATASIQTTEKIALPGTFTCYVSKQSNNTTSSTWKIQVSSDGSTWTDVASQSATSMNAGTWVEFTANLEGYSDVYVRLYYSGSTAVRNVDDISITMRDPNAKTTPTVTIDATGLTTDIAGSTNVAAGTITATVTSGENTISTPAVTWSSSNTAVATVDANTGAVTLITVGTTTITASFAGNDDYNEASNTYELAVTNSKAPGASAETAYTVAQARVAIDAGTGITEVYVRGTVSEIVTAFNSQYGNISYNISADGTTTSNQLEVYRGKSYNGANFTSEDDIQVGDVVVIYGNLTKYGETYEFEQNSELVSLQRTKIDPTIVVNSTETVSYGSTFTVDDSVIEGGAITVTSGNTNVATVDGLVINPVAVGTVIITVATAENVSYNAGSETFELTVTAPAGLTTAPTGSAGGTIFEETFASSTGTNDDFGTTTTTDGNGTFTADNGNVWAVEKGYGANGAAKFGSSKAAGSATTPSISATVGSSYTLTFKAAPWASETTTMTVTVTGGTISGISETAMTTGEWNNYTATITASATSFTISFAADKNRFFLDEVKVEAPASPAPAITATLNASGFGTFCSQYPLDFSSATDYSAWQITSVSGTTINFEQVTGSVKGGTGLLLKGENGTTGAITLISSDSDTELSSNKLVGTLAPTYVVGNENDGYDYYGLSGNQFVKVNAGTVPAGKALLPASALSSGSSGVKSFTFVFNGADGIQTVEHVSAEEAAAIFNLAGQRLQKVQRGVNIIGGRKVLVK